MYFVSSTINWWNRNQQSYHMLTDARSNRGSQRYNAHIRQKEPCNNNIDLKPVDSHKNQRKSIFIWLCCPESSNNIFCDLMSVHGRFAKKLRCLAHLALHRLHHYHLKVVGGTRALGFTCYGTSSALVFAIYLLHLSFLCCTEISIWMKSYIF